MHMKTVGKKMIDHIEAPFNKPRSKGGLPIVMKDNTLEARAMPKKGPMTYTGNDMDSPQKGY